MAELASVGFDTFAFVFAEAGTYVFSSSCDAASIIVLAVMQEDVRLVCCVHLRTSNFLCVPTVVKHNNTNITPLYYVVHRIYAEYYQVNKLWFGASYFAVTNAIVDGDRLPCSF